MSRRGRDETAAQGKKQYLDSEANAAAAATAMDKAEDSVMSVKEFAALDLCEPSLKVRGIFRPRLPSFLVLLRIALTRSRDQPKRGATAGNQGHWTHTHDGGAGACRPTASGGARFAGRGAYRLRKDARLPHPQVLVPRHVCPHVVGDCYADGERMKGQC